MRSPSEIEIDLDLSGADGARAKTVRRGRRLGRYLLCYELASGGMATVYLARVEGPAGFEKLVALKVIHPHLVNEPGFIEMFLDEARIVAQIAHPNVCSVFDFGEADETYYIAMEYLVGETTSRLMRMVAKKADLRSTLVMAKIAADACEGLHAAHELRGADGRALSVVHRDVTPQNLFVGYDGAVRVVDFGVASAVGRVHQTTAGALKGKYAYMAPEQVLQKTIDRRADVWSLGVCLWEMLALRRLFRRGNEYETLQAVTQDAIPPPSVLRADVPMALDAVVLRALERDPDKRYPTAREFGRALNGAIASMGHVSVADVAELMHSLFGDEHRQRMELVDRARKMEPDADLGANVEQTHTRGGYGEEDKSHTSLAKMRPGAQAARSASKRGWLWAALVLCVLAIAGGAAGAVFAFGGGSDEVAQVTPAAPVNEPAPQPAPTSPEPPAPEPAIAVDPIERTETRAERPPHREGDRERTGSRRTPREPDSAMEQGGTGVVNVVTPPGWAEIIVRGRRVGRSPAELTLPAGRHVVRILPYGEEPAITRTVVVPAGGVARLSVRLPP
jgi:serine/threonine-protein kinase